MNQALYDYERAHYIKVMLRLHGRDCQEKRATDAKDVLYIDKAILRYAMIHLQFAFHAVLSPLNP